MGDVLPNSVCSKCGAKNTLERDDEGDLHCWSCGTDQDKNPDAVALGRLGGAKGGKARSEKLTPERRTEIARNAVKTRWAKEKMNHQQIMERHKYYEDNKQAILADIQSIGRPATCRKWSIPGGSLPMLLHRWEKESKRKRQGIDVHERSKYYEDNKEAIIADLLTNGRRMTRQKWGITSSSLFNLEKKWLTSEQKAAILEKSNRYRKHISSDRPIFSLISLIDPSMIGLLQKLPKCGVPWDKHEREPWKRAFDALFEFLYPEQS